MWRCWVRSAVPHCCGAAFTLAVLFEPRRGRTGALLEAWRGCATDPGVRQALPATSKTQTAKRQRRALSQPGAQPQVSGAMRRGLKARPMDGRDVGRRRRSACEMVRAFSPPGFGDDPTWGCAPGWDGAAPLALARRGLGCRGQPGIDGVALPQVHAPGAWIPAFAGMTLRQRWPRSVPPGHRMPGFALRPGSVACGHPCCASGHAAQALGQQSCCSRPCAADECHFSITRCAPNSSPH